MIKYDSIEKYSRIHPNKPALIDKNGVLSWAEFRYATYKLISVISLSNSIEGNPCLYISRNSNSLALLGAAFSTLGIPFQGLDYHLDMERLNDLVKLLNVKNIFISNEFKNKLNDISGCEVHCIETYVDEVKIKLDDHNSDNIQINNNPIKNYVFTFGADGTPKTGCRTDSFEKKLFQSLQSKYSFNGNDIHLICMPMHHASSLIWMKLFLLLGCTVVICNYENNYNLYEIMHRHNISTTILSPMILKEVVEGLNQEDKEIYFPALRFIITCGKNYTMRLKHDAINVLGNIIHEYYGSPETGINTILDSDKTLKYPGSVGCELEGNKIKIINDNNETLTLETIGRIAINSYMNMDDYVEDTAEFVLLDGEKYLLTSDYGYKNAEGYLFVVKRGNHSSFINNHIIYGLENELLNLTYLFDVHVYAHDEKSISCINVIPKNYQPSSKIRSDIKAISQKYGISEPVININSELDYTLTGKLNHQYIHGHC